LTGKVNILVAINPLDYVKESKAELDKVVWPTRQETLRLTIVVLIVSVLIGAYIAGLDTFFTLLVERFLKAK
jgi:preprotein translocase subunit SecE